MHSFHLFEAKWTLSFRAATRNYRIIIDKLCKEIERRLENEFVMQQTAPDAVPCMYDY